MTTPGQIDVDLLELNEVWETFDSNLEVVLKPGISDASSRIQQGLPVGERSESGEVDVSRQVMAEMLHGFARNTEVYVRRSEQVKYFLTAVLENYRTADDFARMDIEAVTQKFIDISTLDSTQLGPTSGEKA
ncbi:MAG TPA: hypothetical protein VF062_03330 [Candidatus Limnocylindrales bacterium]